ncbi:MAG: TonB family protein [Methylobacter sp.]|nr:TonB family protein [Methylobacter sp.]
MFLLNSHKDGRSFAGAHLFASIASVRITARPLFKALIGQENPSSMRGLLLILVLLVHVWAVIWLMRPAEIVTKAQPMMMEVSLVAAPSQQATAAPVAQTKPEEPKKPPLKKPEQKKKPVVRKQKELPKPVAKAEQALPAPALSESTPAPVTPSVAAPAPSKTAADLAPFTEANFNANYGSNPKPKYPGIATNRGWEGTVRLLVKVSVDGDSEEVTVQRSSGYDVLDEAAIEAVEKWKFIPAKRGDTPTASSVIVPINFVLNH